MSAEAELNETDLELISASLDEDLPEFERRRLNTSILAKTEGEKTWVRYSAASALIRKQFPAQIDKDFSSQVMRAISEQGYEQDEESAAQVKIKRVSSHLKQVAGLAVAASVAAFSVVSYQYFNQPAGIDEPQLAYGPQPSASSSDMVPSKPIAVSNAQQVDFAPATAQSASTTSIAGRQANHQAVPNQGQSNIDASIHLQELSPYIQGHADYGSQRMVMPYVEIIELKDVE